MITRVAPSMAPLDMVSTFGVSSLFPPGLLVTASSQTAAARTEYYALDIPSVHVVRRFWWANGATVNAATNFIMALYRDNGFKPGARIATTAATAQGNANEIQFANPSGGDFSISPGLYWIAIAASQTTTTTNFGNALTQQTNLGGAFQEATITPPATATPLEKTGTTYYLCGFSTVASP